MYVLPPSTMSSSLGSWDADFVKVDQAMLFDLILPVFLDAILLH
ncbi:hypothetical protein ES288_D08G183900v1 [Gossypium darwinii]|uniref:Uncharacterized protein n=1 Tax=Gossypium darwinii TaxID=34276 RepID=A0A5D2BNE0_GOSDA|nr:hypothetical protein ES288_D08G183900v1 [Gossypium darwinii]